MTRSIDSPRPPAKTQSLVDLIENDPATASELAAARVTSRVQQVLRKAFEASSMSQRELAEILGVGESRVSQVLNGDGNIRITALARYLRAMGFMAEFTATPLRADLPDISVRKRVRNRKNTESHVYIDLLQNKGAGEKYTRVVIQEPTTRSPDAVLLATKTMGKVSDSAGLQNAISSSSDVGAHKEWLKVSSHVHRFI